MRTQRTSALLRVLALGVIVGAVLLTTPAPAQACAGGYSWAECMAYWVDAVYWPCLDENCAGLTGSAWEECRRQCWTLWRDIARGDCTNCPI